MGFYFDETNLEKKIEHYLLGNAYIKLFNGKYILQTKLHFNSTENIR
jgi:hypothetical protein